jgi:plasmid stabilization system protein ParE
MRIRWTKPAARDLTNVCDYTQEHNGSEAARKLALRVHEAIGSLPKFPHLGRSAVNRGPASLSFLEYPSLPCTASAKTLLEIARILHGAQKWP